MKTEAKVMNINVMRQFAIYIYAFVKNCVKYHNEECLWNSCILV
jgi:hypothetical protein